MNLHSDGTFRREKAFYMGKTNPVIPEGGSVGRATHDSDINTFNDLKKEKDKKKKTRAIYEIFRNLDNDFGTLYRQEFEDFFKIYSGNDEEFKTRIAKFFRGSDYIYDTFEINSIIKSILAKEMQPFYSKDQLITITPTPETLKTYERVESLISAQLKEERVKQEIYKAAKDAHIYGIGYILPIWSIEEKLLPKRVLTDYVSIDPLTREEIHDTIEETIEETITTSRPDVSCINPRNILFPAGVTRWSDLPYVIRLESVSQREFNQRYIETPKETQPELKPTGNNFLGVLKDNIDQIFERIPGSDTTPGGNAYDEVRLAHIYFNDESYYVLALNTPVLLKDTIETGATLVYEGTSPVPGKAIPIIPLIREPLSHRIIGESTVNIAKNDVRKLMEVDNIIMRDFRNDQNSGFFYDPTSGLDFQKYQERQPNTPLEVMDVNGIKPNPLKGLDATAIQLRSLLKSVLDNTTGTNDFFMGNVGRSARISGVDSLLGNALSRLAPAMEAINSLILDLADHFLLLNRAFLPKTYVYNSSSLFASEPVTYHEIPYPVQFRINTPVSAGAEREIMMAGLSQALQIAIQQEQVKPGTWNIDGLMSHYFSQAGVPQVKKFLLKSALTANEAQQLTQIDKAMRLQANSALPNNEDPTGQQMIPPDQQQSDIQGVSRQSARQPSITETGGF